MKQAGGRVMDFEMLIRKIVELTEERNEAENYLKMLHVHCRHFKLAVTIFSLKSYTCRTIKANLETPYLRPSDIASMTG